MSPEDIASALTIDSPELIDEVYQLAKHQVALETGRHTRIESKATALLGSVGISVTVALGLGGQILLQNGTKVHLAPGWLFAMQVGACLALLSGFAAAVFALLALRVREWGVLNEEAVFGDRTLAKAYDAHENEKKCVAAYRRFM